MDCPERRPDEHYRTENFAQEACGPTVGSVSCSLPISSCDRLAQKDAAFMVVQFNVRR